MQAGSDFPIDFLIVSDNYWPSFNTDSGVSTKVHPIVESRIQQYSQRFEILKKPRKLTHIPQMGMVYLVINTCLFV
jgi:hypothetical protein